MARFVREVITRAAEAVAAREGVELYHLEISGSTVRVLIDSPAGITLDACTHYSRVLSDEMDRQDLIPGRYFLEVSSPGVERRLYRPADYAAAKGRRLVIRTDTGTIEGILLRSDEQGIALLAEQRNQPDEPATETIVGFDKIRSARIKLTDAELFRPKES